MSDVVITRIASATPDLAAFVSAHHAEMQGTAPPESQHALPIDGLLAPHVRLFAATLDDRIVGTGALATVDHGHEELKSMRTDPALRGRGIGRTLVRFLLDDATARGVRQVSLETGRDDFFLPAVAMYTRAGFRECAAFGRYRPDPHSVFLTLELPARGTADDGAHAIMNA
ncbi:GNAT family N-acetyltransferase [Microbacterium sp. NPDC059771]|uniref:GNAT family N-acetyltransferase n=1 Tax=Microbacterium sp. NPDC059771 TaxID=3346941 RepID=UPI00365D1F6B